MNAQSNAQNAGVTTPLSSGRGAGGEAVFVYCEIEGCLVQEVSQELLTKGRKLANELGVNCMPWSLAPASLARWKTRFCPMV